VTPLRQRMLEDLQIRHAVRFVAHADDAFCSLDLSGNEDSRAYVSILEGISPPPL
jgi:hypothetical protein